MVQLIMQEWLVSCLPVAQFRIKKFLTCAFLQTFCI
jgi:hypothetical protein